MSTNVTAGTDWFSFHIPAWSTYLTPILSGKPINAIELGSFEGRSTVWLLENILTHPNATIDCVDTWNGDLPNAGIPLNWPQFKSNFMHNISPYSDKVTVHEQSTTQYLKQRTEPADFIYVDAGHRADETLVDGVLSHLLLKPGGVIVFDDYLWTNLETNPLTPKGAVDAFMNCFSRFYTPLGIGYQVLLQKLVL